MRRELDGRTVFFLVLLVAAVGCVIYWYITKPTPQEAAVTGFFNEVRQGNAENASKYLIGASYGDFLFQSKIMDSDGVSLTKGLELDKGALSDLAWDYIPAAKARVFKFATKYIQTKKSETDPAIAFVQFEYDFAIKESFDEPGKPGSIKGTMECSRIDGKWLIKRGDMTIKIIGITLRRYWEE